VWTLKHGVLSVVGIIDYRSRGSVKGRILGVECGVGSVRCRGWSLGMWTVSMEWSRGV
jgi:hypothetical protein